jgi:hypothetical protein
MDVVVVGKRVVDCGQGCRKWVFGVGAASNAAGGDRRAQNLPAAKRDRCREAWVDRRKKRRRGRKMMMMEVRLTRKNSGRGCFFWFGIGNTKIRQLAVGVVSVPNQRRRMGYGMVMKGLGW